MNKPNTMSRIVDSRGNPMTPIQRIKAGPNISKNAVGLYGSIFAYPNYGKYRPRFYTLGDSSQGLDTLSRELLVRWSREMDAQLPFIKAAVNALADFSIGNAYDPQYHGKKKEWWKVAQDWLMESFYPNCNVRGSHYDFKTCLKIENGLLAIDGDYLVVFGEENGFPKFQIIQNNRIRSQTKDNTVVTEGKYKGCIVSDGVYYTPQGKAVAYHVQNAGNMVNNLAENTPDIVFSARDAHLIFDPKFIDKTRGVPAIGAAILQALSIQELDMYLMEKIKIQSTIALVEKTPSGEAPLELQQTLEALNQQGTEFGAFNPSPNTHAVDIVQGSQIRYVHAEGGDIKSLDGNAPGNETQDYMARLETQVLSTLGIPHQLIYSTDKTTGRMTSGVAEIMRSAVKRRQYLMDKTAKFRIAWALAKAMESGDIPRNDDENIFNNITMTHPEEFTLDKKYDASIILNNMEAGVSTFNDTTTQLFNRSAEDTLEIQKNEQIMFYTKAKEVAKATDIPVETVIQGWRTQNKPVVQLDNTPQNNE